MAVALIDNTLLAADEVVFGEYQVQIARMSSAGWTPTMPPLYATITDRRILLKPQTRRRYSPAIIPARHILQHQHMLLGQHNGVALVLSNDYTLYLIIGWRDGDKFIKDLHKMLAAPPKVRFTQEIDTAALFKLIDAVKTL